MKIVIRNMKNPDTLENEIVIYKILDDGKIEILEAAHHWYKHDKCERIHDHYKIKYHDKETEFKYEQQVMEEVSND